MLRQKCTRLSQEINPRRILRSVQRSVQRSVLRDEQQFSKDRSVEFGIFGNRKVRSANLQGVRRLHGLDPSTRAGESTRKHLTRVADS
eukprot:6432245-Prymnesium_polylepis.1